MEKTLIDLTFVQELLKRFGIVIYTGDRLGDLTLMELELQDLYEWKLISKEEFLEANGILKKEMNHLSK